MITVPDARGFASTCSSFDLLVNFLFDLQNRSISNFLPPRSFPPAAPLPARGSFSSMNIFASLSKLFYPSALYLVYLHRCFKRRRFYAFHEEVSKRQFPFPFQRRGIVKNPINVVTEFPFLFIRSFLRPLRGGGGIGCLSSHVYSFFLFFSFFGEGRGGWSLV